MNTYVIGHINAMQMLVKNFPMSLLDFFKGKQYDNILDFILDVLYACGIDVEKELHNMLCKLFKVEDVYFSPDVLYDKLSKANLKVESKFLDGLEDAVKVAIIESLVAVLGGCSVIPEINNAHMDCIGYKKLGAKFPAKTTKKDESPIKMMTGDLYYGKQTCGYISIPLSSIDISGKFRISPVSPTGVCIYDLDSKQTYTAEMAYTYYKATINTKNGQEVRYFLTRATAEAEVRKLLHAEQDAAKNAGESYYNVNNYIKEYKAGVVTEGIESYESALKIAGYLSKEDANGSMKELYDLLKNEEGGKYLKKSFYKAYIKMNPPCSPNDLYKSKDLDAFIWYVMYRGDGKSTQYERNKMVWDSRRYKNPRTDEEWKYWLDSKKEKNLFIYQEEDSNYFESVASDARTGAPIFAADTDEPFKHKYKGIYPIMQLERDPVFASENRLAVYISAQRYYRGNDATCENCSSIAGIWRLNHTMYKFNYDYMRSIKIFNTKAILAGMLNELLNGSLLAGLGFDMVLNNTVLEAQLSKVVKTAIETDDFLSSDCYFKFSNDEYDMMLHREELNRYKAKDVNAPGVPAAVVDVDEVLDAMNEANTSATPEGTVTTIQRTVTSLTATPSSEGVINIDGSLDVSMSNLKRLLYNVIMAIIKPILMCLLAPKVMLIFIINFQIAGLIDLTDPRSSEDAEQLINDKIFSVLKCLIKILLNKIYQMLLELFYEYIMPILTAYIIQALIEYMEKWLKLLKEALQCIPMFNWNKYKLNAQIDNVDYADIINNPRKTPETTQTC
jgi:hypothetical protein